MRLRDDVRILPLQGRWQGAALTEGCPPLVKWNHVHFKRHPELVSGSILLDQAVVGDEKWMLKQVQHDVGNIGKAYALYVSITAKYLCADTIYDR